MSLALILLEAGVADLLTRLLLKALHIFLVWLLFTLLNHLPVFLFTPLIPLLVIVFLVVCYRLLYQVCMR